MKIRFAPGRGQRSYKGYVALFVCYVTRAIHLELVSYYTSQAFLSAYKRFIASRGIPAHFYSDNGATFQVADRELRENAAQLRRDLHLTNFLSVVGTTWHFIPPAAPNFAGLWEAVVKSLTHHLRRCVGSHTLTFEEFSTTLSQIEAYLNSRPIGPHSEEPNDFSYLTPGHFLIEAPLTSPSDPSVEFIPENRLKRWQIVQRLEIQGIQGLIFKTISEGGSGDCCGVENCGVLISSNIWVSSRTENTLSKWKMYEVHTTLKNGEVVENCDVIFLAVKPHLLDSMVQDTVNTLTQTATSKLFISVLAGVPLDTLMNTLLCISPNPRIVRSMPNTPMMVGEGIIVYCLKNTTVADQDLVNTLFSYTGITQCVPESLINAISGLSGSGPAYVYLMIEAFADGAVKMGVPREMATKFAAQVMIGAGKMVLHSGKHPGQLKDEVCSPGGTTIEGIHALERGSVRCALVNAIEAAVKKSDTLSSKK
ncbi:pyrroline-5-carboxylate reductase 3-like [Belonocnema kinseyi]|uniref:pyrroline-5-carboxylate reductase 3-like n=1 Tax=Belonocnema kinseyi TaxID=2817044 RepID=UPI00143D2DE6|nr:pyrroline-5-carboxylate reductase 3-like [Belonocnema kinseyi]